MNAIVTALAEQGLTLGAILLLAIFMQAKLHGLGDSLRKEMSDMRDDLRKEMSDMRDDLRKEMSDMRDDLRKEISNSRDALRKDIGKQGERIARIEGLLAPGAPYEVVAEPPSGGKFEPEQQ